MGGVLAPESRRTERLGPPIPRLAGLPDAVLSVWGTHAAKAHGCRIVWCNRFAPPPERVPEGPDDELTLLLVVPTILGLSLLCSRVAGDGRVLVGRPCIGGFERLGPSHKVLTGAPAKCAARRRSTPRAIAAIPAACNASRSMP